VGYALKGSTGRAFIMSATDWLQAAKSEEQRLLREIMKTKVYKQLEAVRTVIAVYEGTAESAGAASAATGVSVRANGPTSQHNFKVANAFTELSDAASDASLRSKPQ
jgi:hypothetical protein